MNVRLRDTTLASELAAYLRERGFLVVERSDRELDVHLLNHVSERYDRAKAQAAWAGVHPDDLIGDPPASP